MIPQCDKQTRLLRRGVVGGKGGGGGGGGLDGGGCGCLFLHHLSDPYHDYMYNFQGWKQNTWLTYSSFSTGWRPNFKKVFISTESIGLNIPLC